MAHSKKWPTQSFMYDIVYGFFFFLLEDSMELKMFEEGKFLAWNWSYDHECWQKDSHNTSRMGVVNG